MYCPSCGTENIEGAKFCRACGVNISLVPQALTGQLQQSPQQPIQNVQPVVMDSRAYRRWKRENTPVSLSNGVSKVFTGLAFIAVAIAILRYAPAGNLWWFWMLIPAFATIGKGVGEIFQAKRDEKRLSPQLQSPQPQQQQHFQPAPQVSSLPPRNTSEFIPAPPSVTENTTRHLGAEMPTKIFSDKK